MSLSDFVAGLPLGLRILFIVFLAVAAHFLVRAIRYLSEWFLAPEGLPHEILARRYPKLVKPIARGMHRQHRGILLAEPELMGVQEADPGGWRYLRLKFRLWPGQGALLETAFRQRLLSALKAQVPDYADWMITVTYRAE